MLNSIPERCPIRNLSENNVAKVFIFLLKDKLIIEKYTFELFGL